MQYNKSSTKGDGMMICTSQIQAEKVAQAGARKMGPANYAVEENAINAGKRTNYKVTNLESGERYRVNIAPGNTFCTCGFFLNNKQFGTCKHIVTCRLEAAYAEYCDQQEGE
jgi:hypothetical protein